MSEDYKNPLDPFNAAADRVVAATKEKEEPVEPQAEEAANEEIKEEIVEEVVEETSPETEEEVSTESEPPSEEDTTPEEETSTEDVQEEDTVISDWDVSPSEDADKPAEFDFTSLAKEAGIEAANKDEFLQKVTEIKAKAEAPDPTSTLPDNLKKAIEIAGQDGNYLEYLGVTSVDYDAVPSIDLVKSHYQQIFTNVNGVVDVDMLEMKLDGMTDADIEIEGQTLKSQYKGLQEQRAAGIEAEAARNREAADRELQNVLNETKEIDGFKLSPTHKKQLYDGITSGDMIAEMFHGADGKIDQAKVLKLYSKHKFGDKQTAFLRQQITTKVTKKLLDKLSNKQIEPPAGKAPNVKPAKEKTGQAKLAEELREHGAELFKG